MVIEDLMVLRITSVFIINHFDLIIDFLDREECEKLTNIIKSRVVETPLNLGTEVGRQSEMYDRAAIRGITFLCI